MPLFVNSSTQRPKRLGEKKDREYHLKYARWTLQSMNHPLHRNFVTKTLTNWSFYKGGEGQWIFDEDLEGFFLDESGDVRNRLKIAKNLIRPMVEQYVGNAVRLSFNAKARATSDFAINRRDEELARMMFYHHASQAIPEMADAIKDRLPIGETELETEEIFENTWVDNHEDDINNLIKFVVMDIEMDEIKVQITKHKAISGLGLYKGYEQNGRYLASWVDPLFFFWDLSARRPDLRDSEYMGEWYYLDAPSIFERFQELTKEEREAIERYSVNQSIDIHRMVHNYHTVSGDKIPVYEVYWKDMEEHEYGYVEDPYGYPYFTRINHPSCDYTDEDLVEPPTKMNKALKKGQKKAKIYVDVLRYCIFTPKEEIGVARSEDIVYEYGEVEYQEKQALDPSNVEFPYKAYCWSYDKGEVLSPLDDAIQPQRFINRLLSVAESHINNSRGSGTVISKDAVDPRDGEETLMRNINKSKPIFVDTTRSGSVQNAVGTYGATIGQGTMAIFDIIGNMQVAMQDMTGINEAMTGTQGGKDALVGVIESQIQRGSIVQEPFYHGLTSILKQAFQHIATVGKRVYAENPRRLAIMTGDGGMHNIIMTKDTELEEHKIFIERSEDETTAIQNGNSLLFTLMQAGMIDQARFANLFNRADADDIARSMREYQKELLEATKIRDNNQAQQLQAQQQQMAMLQREQAAQQQAMMDREDNNLRLDRDAELERTLVKEEAKNDREKMKWENQPPVAP